MRTSNDFWTHLHDMALVFLALAYSTDTSLSDAEVDSISNSLKSWRPNASDQEINEIVLEAASVFFEVDAEREIVQSAISLGSALSIEQRQQVLEDVLRVAEADGVLLNSDLNVLSVLASAWDTKATKDRLLDESTVRMEGDPEWSVLHDIALMYIIMAHSTDGDLSEVEIATMKDRLGEWEPELDKGMVLSILRTALEYYSQSPGQVDIQDSVLAIKEALPRTQRLVILDDLVTIARADGNVKVGEKEIMESLSNAWNVDIRIAF